MSEDIRESCSLCGKAKGDVRMLIVGLKGSVCNYCVDLCVDMVKRDGENASPEAPASEYRMRIDVLHANQMLPKAGLVTMHSGNASGYLPEKDLIIIKPSGMDYDLITAENLVAVRASTGEVLDKDSLRPSVDLPHHLFLYRHFEGIRGIIHTHSNYATAFSAVGESIPLCLTAIADEFGAEIPCAPYAGNEDDLIGQTILAHRNRAPAILLGNHGVFAWGDSPRSALKAAIMTEDVAKTVWLAKQIGTPWPIPSEEVEKWYDRYHNRYGQS